MIRARAAALSVVAALGGCSSTPPLVQQPINRIVLITLDTLRADHLSGFGYPLATSPFIDALAEQSISFTRAYAQSSATGPSHASMFTSLYPIQHGVHRNGLVLDSSFLTLAEMLAAEGFRTGAFVSTGAPLGGDLGQGFEVFDEDKPAVGEKGWRKLYRPADETADAALAWLESIGTDEKVFLWVHFYDPHRPFNPPESYRQEIADQRSRSPMTVDNHRKSIMKKLNIRTRPQLIHYASNEGFV